MAIIINQSAGIFFYSKSTRRSLYLLRNESKNPTWSIPGGKIEKNETLLAGLKENAKKKLHIGTMILNWYQYKSLLIIHLHIIHSSVK